MTNIRNSRSAAIWFVCGIIHAVLLTQSGHALAQDALGYRAPLGSVNYITNQGDIVSYSSFGVTGSSSDHFNDLGLQTSKSKTTSLSWGETLGYGVTNDLEIIFKDNYSANSSTSYAASGSSSSSNSSGFADPTFSILWRAVNQGPAYPLSLDLTASYAPDILDAKDASSVADGTIARGGSVFNGTAAVSHVSGPDIFYLAITATNSSDRDILVQPAVGPYNQTSSAFWQYNINAAYQHYFDDKLSVIGGVQYYSSDSYVLTNQGGNNLSYNRTDGAQWRPYATLNYAFVPNKIVGSLNYTHTFDANSSSYAPADPLKSSSMRDGQSDAVTGTLRLLFR